MFTDPRAWKWMIPALFVVVLLPLSAAVYSNGDDWRVVSLIGFGACAVFGFAAIGNALAYYGTHYANIFYTRRQAMSMTPDALLLQNARQVHPKTLEMIFGERQRAWLLKAGIDLPDEVKPYAVLYARPDVTEYFFWYFLRNSTRVRCMSKRVLSDKSYRFDPLNKVTDYEQYDMLISLFTQRAMCTRESAQEAAWWLPPWEPKLVAETFGYEWDPEEDDMKLQDLSETEGSVHDWN